MKRRVNKKPLLIVFILIVAVFGTLYFFNDNLFSKNAKNNDDIEEIEKKEIVKTVSFTFAGNVLINSEMWYDTTSGNAYDFTYMFEYLNDIMKKSDINVYNQASIVGGSSLGKTANSKYNTPKELLDTMSNIGFNVVMLGTNHAFDKGSSGITNTISYLDELELTYAGITSETKNNIIEKNGVKVGFLSYTVNSASASADSYVDIYSEEKAKSDIESLDADVIVVAVDWCGNETSEINTTQDTIVNYLSSLGVNVIIGNTGYTIQPIKMVNNTLVCYSLGNLMSGHTKVDNRISALVDFKLNVRKLNDNKTVDFDDINVLFSYAYNDGNADFKVIPFSKITNELKDYKTYYTKYEEIVKGISSIKMYPIGD